MAKQQLVGQLSLEGMTAEQKDRAQTLADWWMRMAEDEINMVVPKAIEYGSADLQVMGEAMIRLMPKEIVGRMDRAEKEKTGQEMAIAFYALGKVARLFGAFEQGRAPSADTWLDLGIYSRMGQRVREVGSWG